MRLLIGLLAALLLAGCGSGGNVIEAMDPAAVTVKAEGMAMERAWSASVGGAGELRRRLEPMLADGRVYAAGSNGTVAAFDSATGDTVWRREVEDNSLAGGPAVGEGVVAIGTRDGEVVALDAGDGETMWDAEVTSEVLAPAAIGQGSVVVRTNDGRVYALRSDDGERHWLYDRNVPPLTLRGHSSPVLVKGGVLAGFDNGRLVALKLADGTPAWEATVAVPSGGSDLARMVDVDGDPHVDGSDVFATSYQGRTVGIALGDGSIDWTRDISSYNSVGLDDGAVYVSASDSRIWALDRANGATVWRQDELTSIQLTAPRRHGEHLVVGGSDGYLYWLAPDDGTIVARREVAGSRITVAPLVSGRWLYVQTAGGELIALRRPE